MLLTDITKDTLPIYTIETYDGNVWNTFTDTPFRTRDEADKHRQLMLTECPDADPTRIRIRHYTEDDWRVDVIDAILHDNDALLRALSIIRTESLALALQPVGYLK